MIEGIALIEELDSGQKVPLGLHNFTAIPTAGNRVILANKMGGLAAYEVVATEHTPIKSDGPRKAAGKLPWCAIYLKLLDPMSDVYLEMTGEL